MSTLVIAINGEQVYFTLQRGNGGRLLLEESGSEQCEGCGDDIVESGFGTFTALNVPPTVGVVRCACGASYPIRRATDRRDV
jgi:hypothetical protein